MTSVRDLRTWVDERIGPEGTPEEADRIVEWIRTEPGRPLFGHSRADWVEWLENVDFMSVLGYGPTI